MTARAPISRHITLADPRFPGAVAQVRDILAARGDVTEERIVWAVGVVLGVTRAQLLGPARGKRSVQAARMLAMYLCRQLLGASYPAAARAVHRDDHTTAMHACRMVEEAIG